jgi:hypothetical protein
MRLLKASIRILTGTLLAALAINLLILYYRGCWWEPNQIIEINELVFLYAFAVWGIAWTVYQLKREAR